ncbi:acyltransferase [Anaerovibrio lipolyticus]|uniref:acyltransferase n=1 Tax=Anaerovibrio lipolyticus TaxID=82374 RepID=UPI00056B2FA6|nr:acyltransferase [Anaerovibrio lipolyticus]
MGLRNIYERYKFRRTMKRFAPILEITSGAIVLNTTSVNIQSPQKRKYIYIEEEAIVGCNFIFESGQGTIRIGKRSYIGAGTNLLAHSDIIIGDDVTLAWGIWVYTHDSHSLDWCERIKDLEDVRVDYRSGRNLIASKDWSGVNTAPIRICDKAWIGMNAIILKGVTIGEGAVVGAGSVVTHDVPAWSVVAGNPARVVKMLNH